MLTAGLLEQTRELQSGAQRDEGCHAGIRSGRLLSYNLESQPDRRAGTASKADRAVKNSMGFKSSALRHTRIAQLVERHLDMVKVTGSRPVAGTNYMKALGLSLMPLAFTRDCSFSGSCCSFRVILRTCFNLGATPEGVILKNSAQNKCSGDGIGRRAVPSCGFCRFEPCPEPLDCFVQSIDVS